MKSEWQTIQDYEMLKEALERTGFELKFNESGLLNIKTPYEKEKKPYAKNVVIKSGLTISEALMFLHGYEQHIFELEQGK
jgi:hypothetical protein